MNLFSSFRAVALCLVLLHGGNEGRTAAFAPALSTPQPANMGIERRGVLLWSTAPTPSREAAGEATTNTEEHVPSVTRFPLPCAVKTAWEQLIPPLVKGPNQRGCDVTVEWTVEDGLTQVAASLLKDVAVRQHQDVLEQHLAECLREFQDFCLQHLSADSSCSKPCCGSSSSSIQGFRARIVASRGSSGTKCPRWHIDHVPVRWIQSLAGPGCDYMEGDYSNRSLESLQEFLNGESKNNNGLPRDMKICQAKEQEVALLVGNRWKEFARKQNNPLPAAVLHKSPEIPPFQGRVLLTMDVLVPHQSD